MCIRDRFWIVDVNVFGYAFTGNPNLTLGFTYSPTEDIQAGNLIAGIPLGAQRFNSGVNKWGDFAPGVGAWALGCLLYTSDAADERSSVDLGGRRIFKKKKQ